MKKVNGLLLLVFMLLGSVAHADTQAEVAQTLNDFHRAAARADMNSYYSAITEDVVFLGTDGSERWQGQGFRDFVSARFSKGLGWTYTPVERRITIAADGQIAWFDETLQNDGLGLCRGSGVLVKSGAHWKIAQYNLSVPVPNAMVHQVVADIATLDGSAVAGSEVGASSTAAPSAIVAPAAPAVTDDAPAQEAEPADCLRKRFKTNRKAGC